MMDRFYIKLAIISFFIVNLSAVSCVNKDNANPQQNKELTTKGLKPSPKFIDHSDQTEREADSLSVLILPISNGYEYGMHNFDFTPILEEELKKFVALHLIPFPYKELEGVSYQGVFDKSFCPPIIEKVNADFIILTRFSIDYDELSNKKNTWGYEVRIVNTSTLEQSNSIQATNLASYQRLEAHLRANISILRKDIEKMKLAQ